MGGNIEALDKDSLFTLNVSNELDKISCCVDFSNLSNFDLLNRDFLLKKFQEESKKFFKKNGIKYEIEDPGDKGGGGLSNLWEILKQLWVYKDFMLFISSFFGYFVHIYNSFLEKNTISQKPRIEISLIINSKKKLNKKRLKIFQGWYFVNKISNLLIIGNALCNEINNLHNYLCCDLSVRCVISGNNYMVNFDIPHEDRTDKKISKLLHIIKNLKIKNNKYSDYNFAKWNLIKRTDSEFEIEENSSSCGPNFNKYYLLFSSKIIKDYFNF